jgi:glycosyltransferase involved in cell wall biosynthesis
MDDKLRVLHCVLDFYPTFTGHGIYLEELFKFQNKKQIVNSILTLNYKKYSLYEEKNDLIIYRLPFLPGGGFSDLRQSISILKFLFDNRKMFDVLHLHGHVDIYGFFAVFSKVFRKKIVMQMVLMGSDDPITIKKSYKAMWARFQLFLLMDRFLCISKPLVDACLASGIPNCKISYIPQGVNDVKFHKPLAAEKSNLKKSLGFLDDCKIVVFVGAIIERKGVDILVKAWKSIQASAYNSKLLLVGPYEFGDEDKNKSTLSSFVKEIENLICSDNLDIHFIGRTSEVEKYLKIADVFVLPSRKEGFGNVILEAMACGVPPVVTGMDGVALETVEDGSNGYIISDDRDLAEKVTSLLLDTSMNNSMSEKSIDKIRSTFSMEKIAPRYIKLYESLYEERVCVVSYE